MVGLEKPEQILKAFQAVGDSTCDGRYLHWDEIRFRKPPEGLTHQDWWLGLKMRRRSAYRNIPLKDTGGNNFHFSVPDLVTDLLHQIDRGGGTFVEIPEQVTNAEQRDRYVIRSLMEEAITSSQLEGGSDNARRCQKNARRRA